MTPVGAITSVSATAQPDQGLQRAAEGFERVLIGQLTKQLQATTGAEEGAGAAGAYASMLPDAMADALSANGGIGLSDELVRALRTGA